MVVANDEKSVAVHEEIPAHCVAVHAEYLGMDPKLDRKYFCIAEEALRASLPDGWAESTDVNGTPYYYNRKSRESMWRHPLDQLYRKKFQQCKADDSASGEVALVMARRRVSDKKSLQWEQDNGKPSQLHETLMKMHEQSMQKLRTQHQEQLQRQETQLEYLNKQLAEQERRLNEALSQHQEYREQHQQQEKEFQKREDLKNKHQRQLQEQLDEQKPYAMLVKEAEVANEIAKVVQQKLAEAQSNVHVAEKRAEESERRAKEEDLRRSKVAAESAGVQQSIIQRLTEASEKQTKIIAKLKKTRKALEQRVEDAESKACELVANRLNKEQIHNTELQLQLQNVEKERDFFQQKCSKDRQQIYKSKHEATAELILLQEKLDVTDVRRAAEEQARVDLEKSFREELQAQRETLQRQHDASTAEMQHHAEAEMRQCVEEALAETQEQFRGQMQQQMQQQMQMQVQEQVQERLQAELQQHRQRMPESGDLDSQAETQIFSLRSQLTQYDLRIKELQAQLKHAQQSIDHARLSTRNAHRETQQAREIADQAQSKWQLLLADKDAELDLCAKRFLGLL